MKIIFRGGEDDWILRYFSDTTRASEAIVSIAIARVYKGSNTKPSVYFPLRSIITVRRPFSATDASNLSVLRDSDGARSVQDRFKTKLNRGDARVEGWRNVETVRENEGFANYF